MRNSARASSRPQVHKTSARSGSGDLLSWRNEDGSENGYGFRRPCALLDSPLMLKELRRDGPVAALVLLPFEFSMVARPSSTVDHLFDSFDASGWSALLRACGQLRAEEPGAFAGQRAAMYGEESRVFQAQLDNDRRASIRRC
jgi:hypothetical protein